MGNLNLICVKWGTLYGPEYVINLYNAAKKHSTVDFTFHVFTDDSSLLPNQPDWVIHRLPDWNLSSAKAWWYKMEMFNPAHDLRGRNLFMDLDVMITANIDDMWAYGKADFAICQDFNRVYIKDYPKVNSSVMAWSDDRLRTMHDSFAQSREKEIQRFRGDQDYIGEHLSKHVLWPPTWVRSYRWEIWRGGIVDSTPNKYAMEDDVSIIPDTCKVIAFHGKPKPHEITETILKKAWSGA